MPHPPLRPRRSALYMPGANERALDKARSLDADCLIFDLEDAVSPSTKMQARQCIANAVRQGGYGRQEIIVRINSLQSPWGVDDIAAIASLNIDAVLLPKIESARQVCDAVAALDAAGLAPSLPIWVMAETPRAILAMAEIAAAHPRLAVLVMGTSDLSKELRARHTPDRAALIPSLGIAVLAARAHGLDILDGVHLDLNDSQGLHNACRQGRDMGFDGKSLIHPKQIASANKVFAPTEAEITTAQRILKAWDEAQRQNLGVAVVDGRLIENLHASEARHTLAMAEAITSNSHI